MFTTIVDRDTLNVNDASVYLSPGANLNLEAQPIEPAIDLQPPEQLFGTPTPTVGAPLSPGSP
jgi:hypothetical protein